MTLSALYDTLKNAKNVVITGQAVILPYTSIGLGAITIASSKEV